MNRQKLIRQSLAAICVALATSGGASAEDPGQDNLTISAPLPDDGAALLLTAIRAQRACGISLAAGRWQAT